MKNILLLLSFFTIMSPGFSTAQAPLKDCAPGCGGDCDDYCIPSNYICTGNCGCCPPDSVKNMMPKKMKN